MDFTKNLLVFCTETLWHFIVLYYMNIQVFLVETQLGCRLCGRPVTSETGLSEYPAERNPSVAAVLIASLGGDSEVRIRAV